MCIVVLMVTSNLMTSLSLQFLPWNKGRSASCSVVVRYFDQDFRVVEDKSGDLFVYSRPVVSRSLDM